jgi:hypothetical protein
VDSHLLAELQVVMAEKAALEEENAAAQVRTSHPHACMHVYVPLCTSCGHALACNKYTETYGYMHAYVMTPRSTGEGNDSYRGPCFSHVHSPQIGHNMLFSSMSCFEQHAVVRC